MATRRDFATLTTGVTSAAAIAAIGLAAFVEVLAAIPFVPLALLHSRSSIAHAPPQLLTSVR